MKKVGLFKLLMTMIGGPLAGAFGLWLLAEAPAIHAAMCQPSGV